jgi:hypothetical protein
MENNEAPNHEDQFGFSRKVRVARLGEIVIFTAARGQGDTGVVDEYAALVVGVKRAKEGILDLKTFGPNSMYSNHAVPYNSLGKPGTWRLPKRWLDVQTMMTVDPETGDMIESCQMRLPKDTHELMLDIAKPLKQWAMGPEAQEQQQQKEE